MSKVKNANASEVTVINQEVSKVKKSKGKKATVTVLPVNGATGEPVSPALAKVMQKAAELAKKPLAVRKRKLGELKDCICGCGKQTRSTFAPGCNGRLQARLVKQYREEAAQAALKANLPAEAVS